jgi:hypothetical protein
MHQKQKKQNKTKKKTKNKTKKKPPRGVLQFLATSEVSG